MDETLARQLIADRFAVARKGSERVTRLCQREDPAVVTKADQLAVG